MNFSFTLNPTHAFKGFKQFKLYCHEHNSIDSHKGTLIEKKALILSVFYRGEKNLGITLLSLKTGAV